MDSLPTWSRAELTHEVGEFPKWNGHLLLGGELPSHGRFNFLRCVRECGGEVHESSVRRIPHNVLDSDAELLFRNVNSGLDREHGSLRNWRCIVARIVHLQPDIMTDAVNEILP